MMKSIALVGILGAVLCAQEFRSTISGRVTDPSGAAVPGVKILATEKNTGAKAEATTGGEGEYTLPFLPPGPYTLTAEHGGFKKHVQDGITLGTNVRLAVDIALQVGSQSDAITVSADAAMLQTNSASVGQVISEKTIGLMPMNGRTPLTLAQLAYGVTPSSDPRFTRPFDNGGPAGFSMGGGQSQSNELLLDGAPDMTRNRRVAYNPPVDAVQEIKVEAFQPDAAYGNTGGGTVNVVMKGGTNDFHGSLYEFHQNQRLKATPFFTNQAGQTKPVTRFNQYGFTVGGPVMIPKLINGKNKLFFFFGSEGIRQSEPEPTFSTVPTAEQRNGDFSQLLRVDSIYQIYDPRTGVTEGSRIRRQPYPGNIIPQSQLNPVSKAISQFYPLPNAAGTANGTNNYFNNAVRSDTFSSFMGRIDVNASDRHKFFLSGRYNDRVENRGNRFSNIATGNNLLRSNWGVTFDDVYTVSPSLFLNTRLNWSRFVEANIRPYDGFDFTTLGLPASLRAASTKVLLPRIDMGNITDLADSGGDRTPFDSYQIFLAATKIVNRHTIKFGTDLRTQRESSNSYGNSSGLYGFNNTWTRGPLDNSPAAPLGQDMASFFLGLPTSGQFDVNATRTQSAKYLAFFVQDDFRVNSTLSFNLGLRYEKETGTIERYNRTVRGFDPNANLSITAQAKANYAAAPLPILPAAQFTPTGGVLFADDNNRTIYSPPNNAVSPRFGFSWSPRMLGGKTVLRGGYGIFYSTFGTTGIQQPGFSQTTQLVPTLDNFLSPATTFTNPFPSGILQPVGAANGVNTFLGQSVRYNSGELNQPITHRWNFNIQRELGKNMLLELGYMGSKVKSLLVTRQLNYVPEQYLSTSPVRDQATINQLTAVVSNPMRNLLPGSTLNGSTVSTETLLRRYPQFLGTSGNSFNDGVIVDGQSIGYSNFHMAQIRLEKRFASGLQFLTNFQWSKMMEATNRLYEASDALQYRIAGEDRPFRFVFSSTYELPFGKGKALGTNAGPWLNRAIGGWQLAGIFNWQSGGPVEFGNVLYYGGNLQWDARNLNQAFDISRFERNNTLQLDRNRRTFPQAFPAYRADKINNIDLSVVKAIPIVERINMQFRAEAFNAFNHAIFNGPEMSATNQNFGRITSQSNLPRTFQLALRLTF
ncbi:MAG TPA: carboxypeptidase regulatory-like domain-containing protein [Bryobacteraceae bacterium]|nr:carboxypeptidase regulatory-like domain-containing protein [Bryobacteraceae bacterium]